VVQFLFTTLTSPFHKKCNRLKARVVIYAYNHHVRLLSLEPMVVDKPQSTRVEEPTLLCNQVELLPVARDPPAYLNSVVLPKALGREMSARRWLRGSGMLRMIEEAK